MAFALINKTHARSASNSVTTPQIDTTGAHGLFVHAVDYSANPLNSIAMSDSKSNTWIEKTARSGGNCRSRWFYCIASPSVGASHDFTIASSGQFPALEVFAISAGGTLAFNAESAGGTTAGATSIQPASVTPPSSCLFLAGMGFEVINTIAIDSSFLDLQQDQFTSGQNIGGAAAWKESSSAENPTFSWSSSSAAGASMVTFTGSSAGGATRPVKMAGAWGGFAGDGGGFAG